MVEPCKHGLRVVAGDECVICERDRLRAENAALRAEREAAAEETRALHEAARDVTTFGYPRRCGVCGDHESDEFATLHRLVDATPSHWTTVAEAMQRVCSAAAEYLPADTRAAMRREGPEVSTSATWGLMEALDALAEAKRTDPPQTAAAVVPETQAQPAAGLLNRALELLDEATGYPVPTTFADEAEAVLRKGGRRG